MKKVVYSLIAAVAMLLPMIHKTEALAVSAAPETQISIQLDGYNLPTDPQPIGYKGHVMVPFRAVTNALGLSVDYDAQTHTISAKSTTTVIQFHIGDNTALVNGQPITLDAEPISVNDRSFIPIRFLAESIGAQVSWDQTNRQVLITSQQRHLNTMVFYGLGSYDQRNYLPRFDEAAFTWSELNDNGQLVFTQGDYNWPDGGDQLLSSVKNAKVGTSLMVFSQDKDGELSKLIQSDTLTTQFANDLLTKLNAEGMDSATLDFETLGDPSQASTLDTVRAQYVSFIHTVAQALHQQGKKLTVVVAPLNGWYQGYDYKGLAQYADQLYIMAYSYTDDKLPQPLDKIDDAISQAVQQVDPSKLTLGINAFSETSDTVNQKIGLAKRYNLNGVGFWLVKMLDDGFVQSIDDSLKLNQGTTLQ